MEQIVGKNWACVLFLGGIFCYNHQRQNVDLMQKIISYIRCFVVCFLYSLFVKNHFSHTNYTFYMSHPEPTIDITFYFFCVYSE